MPAKKRRTRSSRHSHGHRGTAKSPKHSLERSPSHTTGKSWLDRALDLTKIAVGVGHLVISYFKS